MNKRAVIAILGLCVGVLQADAGDTRKTMHKDQRDFWYTNNFGASAKEVFPTLEPEVVDEETYHVGVGTQDVDLMLGGRIRQEGFIFNRATTLRDDFNDLYGFTRSKLNLDFHTQYGRRQYGKPAAQMHARLTAFSVWDAETTYTPILEQEVYFNASNHLKKAEIGKHDHRGVAPLMYLEEGWVRINFDSFMRKVNNEVSLQIGHFPFMVGRGISLGDYPFTGVEFLGWERQGDIGNATQRPVGILAHFGLGDKGNTAVEFYYSQSRKRSHGPDWTREEIYAKRLDVANDDDPASIQRGTSNDQNIYAVRGNYTTALGRHQQDRLYVEPYAVYVSAPELKVEFDGDASARLFTMGTMLEYNSGNWAVNAEIAGQFGEHKMHAIDRNHLIVDDSYYMEPTTTIDSNGVPDLSATAGRLDERMGIPAKFQSHVLLGVQLGGGDSDSPSASEYLPYRAYYVSDEMQHINTNRGMEAQGALVMTGPDTSINGLKPGSPYRSEKFDYKDFIIYRGGLYGAYKFNTGVDYYDKKFGVLGVKPDGYLHNANVPYGGLRRFRPAYTLDCSSVMAMLDVAYTTPSKTATFAAAAGYVGGDKYPFNEEKDKQYNGFIPMRDANYVGRWVTSFVMLYPRKLPRPTEMSDNDFYSQKNYQTMQNMQYVGLSAKWLPLAHKKTLSIETNALYFWQISPPHVWDKYKTRTFANSKTDTEGGGKEDKFYKYIQDKELHFAGAATSEWASNRLGAELNGVIKWQPFDNCELVGRFGAFFPGKLYSDIQGCPNVNTRRVGSNKDGDVRHESLGTKMVTGGMLRMTYKF